MEEDFARKKAKCIQAIKNIHLLMAKNRIPLPSKYQKSRVHEDLPFEPKIREEEIIRRFKYLEPESREQMAEKLNDLLVYAEVAKALRSELIAIIVLSKLRKWENLLLQPHLDNAKSIYKELEQQKKMDELRLQMKKALSLINKNLNNQSDNDRLNTHREQNRDSDERRQNIEDRDRRVATTLRQYEELGQSRRAAVQSVNPFEERVRTITLPPQTIAPPQSQIRGSTARVDVDEQRRRDMENYQKFGAIRKRLYDLPEYQSDLKGPKLPDHKELEKQRQVDIMRQQLQEAFSSRKRRHPNGSDNNQVTTSEERTIQSKEMIAERDQKTARVLKEYEEVGKRRRAEVRMVNPFQDNVRTVRLPNQTIPLPHSSGAPEATATRVDIDEQRRRDIEHYQKFGAIRKRQHELPEYQRDILGPKLPASGLASTTKPKRGQAETRSKYKQLEKQRELAKLQQDLQDAIQSRKRIRRNSPENIQERRDTNPVANAENPVNDPDNAPTSPENDQ
ncbi:hypothetical protein HA402_015211 [Bradysia odoriphaga]|nr:hypothetical protein HA402_015211 [Bradysia odoriphaga]